MDAVGELVVGLLILVGLAGILVPVLPGLIVVAGSVVVWAVVERDGAAWAIAGLAVALAIAGTVVKFLIPGRRMLAAGLPRSTMYLAGAAAIVGFFVLPVVGAPIAFVLATYLAERNRVGAERAATSTRQSVLAVAMSIGIELAAGLIIASLWLAAVVFWT